MDVEARTRIATAVAAREASDFARGITDLAAGDFTPGSLTAAATRLRLLALAVLDRSVLAERAAGATWAEIAAAHTLNEDGVIARYDGVYARWVAIEARADADQGAHFALPGTADGSAGELDPIGTAQALDSWRERHADPWETPCENLFEAFAM